MSPLTTSVGALLLRFGFGLRFDDCAELRREYRELRAHRDTPLLICANHLTLIDSVLIAYALGAPTWYLFHFSALPWNVPERSRFAAKGWQRVLAYLYKCLPIERGGSRDGVASALSRFSYLLRSGEVGLIFPEGGRSRSGRVNVKTAAYGVGRIVKSAPGCRVLCVYLRGDAQHAYTDWPTRGDRIRARAACIEPKSDLGGVRGSVDISRQIAARLAELEAEHFGAVAA